MKHRLSALLALIMFSAGMATAAAPSAKQILVDAGIKGGLIVHLGCGGGELTAALHANDSYVVQGLGADVTAAREYIQSLGLYGPVSAEQWTGDRLPYMDNLVNLIVADNLGKVPMSELMRVLAPNGVALIGGKKTGKPRPSDTDEWTHFLHDSTGNPVAHDREVGPPRYMQWVEGPRNSRSHEFTPSLAALVSSGGRIFYIVDEAPASSVLRSSQWNLVARDAYNGLLLWQRPISLWWPHIFGWTQGPRQLQRRLVAVGDCVYVTLGLFAPLAELDAATGKTLKVYDQTSGTEEIIWHNGTLLLAMRTVTEERTAERKKWAELSQEKDSPLFTRDNNAPFAQQFHNIDNKAQLSVMAIDAASGRGLWKRTGEDVRGLKPLTLSAAGNKAFFERAREVVCLDLKTGKELWTAPATKMRSAGDYGVICANNSAVMRLSTETGKPVWDRKPLLLDIRDAFVINNTLWLGGFKPWQGKTSGKRGPVWGPYFVTQSDLATGKVLQEINPDNPGHHHRCYVNKATDRFILGGRRGTEFIDLHSGEVLWNSWARGTCGYGVMPANGLFYVPPHACGCYITTKLTGFHALAATKKDMADGASSVEPLERGPAYAEITNLKPQVSNSDWPTYRHDAERSGATKTIVPPKLKPLWEAEIGGKITAPTIAGGRVFVALGDEHRVCAFDADTGKSQWNFIAGARVDTPPTLQGDRALFGCCDGHVYSVRATDGRLAWRLRAARDERLITAHGQLESASPAHGSVLVRDGVAYVTTGRSSYLDGGIDLCRVEVDSGKILSRTPIYSPDPDTGRQPQQYGPNAMPGALADILTSDGEDVYLRDLVFGQDGVSRTKGKPHLLTLSGFLDDTWAHRSYWIFGTHCSLSTGCSSREKGLIFGRLLSFDDATIYGYGRDKVHWSNQLLDGPYRLFAMSRTDHTSRWEKSLPIQVRAMVLANNVLFVAGPLLNPTNPKRGPDTGRGALLLGISATDGAELGRLKLNASPIFDGSAAAKGRLYLSCANGKLICLSGIIEKSRMTGS